MRPPSQWPWSLRVLAPQTELATTRWWHTRTLATELGVADATADELYAAVDWLLARQPVIEQKMDLQMRA